MKKRIVFCTMNSCVSTVLLALVAFVFLLIAAGPVCSEDQTAVVATVAADYSSGAHSVISVDPVGGPRTAHNNLLPTISDITVAAYENHFYRIEMFQADNVTKFHINAPATPIWQFSTLDAGETNSNPHDLVFASAEKAYLLRYGSTKAWIVNPSATTETEFKIGELDLGPYADNDGLPEMHSGVIVGGKLFVTLQRLDATWSPQTAYLAVFDIATDTEIDTGIANPDGVFGIPLDIRNPGAIQYLAENDTIYVQGVGSFFPVEYTGGIVSVDPTTYNTVLVLDDGTDASHLYGQISGMAIISATKGYFVGYAGWGDNTLYSFDPSTGTVHGAVSGYLQNKNIAGLETGVYLDKNDMLWICSATDAEVVILDTTNDSIDETVSTDLNPSKVVFATGTSSGGSGNGDDGGGGGCFIATAAYGSYTEPSVKILRDFRDTYLLHTCLGRSLVNAYYRYSPPIADYIAERSILKAVVRIGLAPIVGISYVMLQTTAMQMAALFSLLFGVSLIAWLTLRTSRRKVEM